MRGQVSRCFESKCHREEFCSQRTRGSRRLHHVLNRRPVGHRMSFLTFQSQHEEAFYKQQPCSRDGSSRLLSPLSPSNASISRCHQTLVWLHQTHVEDEERGKRVETKGPEVLHSHQGIKGPQRLRAACLGIIQMKGSSAHGETSGKIGNHDTIVDSWRGGRGIQFSPAPPKSGHVGEGSVHPGVGRPCP